jgi:hypothetical protein
LNWCNVPESPCHWRSFGFRFFPDGCARVGTRLCDFDALADDAIVGGIMKVTAVSEDAPRCRIVNSHAAAGRLCRNGLPHGAAKATEAAAPEATEAATAAPRPIAGTPTHGYKPMREARWPPSNGWWGEA